MRASNWQPMTQADRAGRWYARDSDGMESWTWHDGDEWMRECWRKDADQQECRSEEWWTPVEYRADA